jgi:hypothetical protein
MRVEEKTTRFPLRLRVWFYPRSVQANGAVRQDRKMIDVALRHMRDDDFIFKNLSFEVSLWHLLIPFDQKPLTSQIKEADEFDLISLIGRPHTERSSAVSTIFNLREGKSSNSKNESIEARPLVSS